MNELFEALAEGTSMKEALEGVCHLTYESLSRR
ncbi:MAG: hypothetical protein HW376_1160, partial [candidate division NC10 bacterium]|nr:hypothetical protein [candidate division NC10 bacterium]